MWAEATGIDTTDNIKTCRSELARELCKDREASSLLQETGSYTAIGAVMGAWCW